MAQVGSLAWASDQAGLVRSSPATWAGLGPAKKKDFFKKILFSKKNMIFRKYFTAF